MAISYKPQQENTTEGFEPSVRELYNKMKNTVLRSTMSYCKN